MGFRLKDFRQAHRMFQSDMAELLETNQSSVSRLELRPSCKLSYLQMQKLYERFGHEDVDAFMEADTEEVSVEITGNTNEGDGTQNNGFFGADDATMGIIRQQSEALVALAKKQSEQTDRLIALLEKITGRP